MKALEIKNLVKDFGTFRAVDNLSFSVEKGSITAFLGPNGAGKTTTIQMILDIITPTSGDIIIFGLDFKHHKEEILGRINFSSPYVSLPTNLTVMENLLTYARLYGVKNPKQKIQILAEEFEIKHLLPRMTASLSTGQLTRVNLAKAFVNDPELLLLDEPTASLDPDIAEKTLSILTKMQKERGVTVLYTSHNMAEIEKICDRVIFINKGVISEEGTPADLIQKFGHKDMNDVFIDLAREEK
ncbi:MAG: ABC transporter ATP-binding protein [Patescibacteria group bacterium]